MDRSQLAVRPGRSRRVGINLFGAAIMATALANTPPAMASTHRGVNMRVLPDYPIAARHQRLDLPVQIDVTVDPYGKLTDAKTLTGNPLLAVAAKTALRKWKFAP